MTASGIECAAKLAERERRGERDAGPPVSLAVCRSCAMSRFVSVPVVAVPRRDESRRDGPPPRPPWRFHTQVSAITENFCCFRIQNRNEDGLLSQINSRKQRSFNHFATVVNEINQLANPNLGLLILGQLFMTHIFQWTRIVSIGASLGRKQEMSEAAESLDIERFGEVFPVDLRDRASEDPLVSIRSNLTSLVRISC